MSQTHERRPPGQGKGAANDQHESLTTRERRARALDLLAQGFAELAAAEREDHGAEPGASIISVGNCETEFPGLTPRAFADAGRAGAFACFKSGRKLAARREDVERWLTTSRRVEPRRSRKVDPAAEYESMVAGAGR